LYTALRVDEFIYQVSVIPYNLEQEHEEHERGQNYVVDSSQERAQDKRRTYYVKADIPLGEFNYECCKFERDDMVCCHILRVMDVNSVVHLPQHFIRRRWTRDADEVFAPRDTQSVLAVHDKRPEGSMPAIRRVVMT